MADLMTALRNADAAGDTAAAQRLAQLLKQQKQQPNVNTNNDGSFAYGIDNMPYVDLRCVQQPDK